MTHSAVSSPKWLWLQRVGSNDAGWLIVPALHACSALVLVVGAGAQTTIDFNNLTVDTIVTDQYEGQGVLFAPSASNPVLIKDITADAASECSGFAAPTVMPSPPNGIRVLCPPAWTELAIASFIDPLCGCPTYVTSFSFTFVSDLAGATHGSLQAYDRFGTPVASDTSVLGGVCDDGIQEQETLSVSAAEIWRVEIGGFDDVIADEVTFTGLHHWTPTTYCTAGTSASGCQAMLSASGSASASAVSGFSIHATGVEGQKDGLYFFGTNGPQANPWGNGTSFQCVTPPVLRTPTMVGSGTTTQCDGSFALDLNALWCPGCPKPAKNPGSGALVQAQFWYRDPASTSNQTTSLSDAIEFCVGP